MSTSSIVLDVLWVTLIGSVISLDRRSAFQCMVSQPIIVVPLLGLLLGDLPNALWLGSVLQLLWLSSLLVGASVPPNETLASTVIGGVVLLYGKHLGTPDLALQALAVLIGVPLSAVGRWADIRIDRANLVLAERADEAARAGDPAALARLPLIGLTRTFGVAAALIAPSLIIGLGLVTVIRPALTGASERAFEVIAVYLLPGLGLAVALSTVRRRRALALAAASFAVVLLALRPEAT